MSERESDGEKRWQNAPFFRPVVKRRRGGRSGSGRVGGVHVPPNNCSDEIF